MQRVARLCQMAIGAASAILLLSLGILVFYQAAARYVTLLPSALWTEEIARGLLIWLVMIGAGWAAFENTHFRLGALESALGKSFHWFGCFATTLCGAYLIYSALPFSARGMARISQVSGLPAAWVYSAILVGGLLIFLGGVSQALRLSAPDAGES